MLVRKQIHKLLSSYYNQPHNAVVGSISYQTNESNPINFRSVLGEWHWRRMYQGLYRNQAGQWLTPVELFRPYYSRIIANFIAMEMNKFSSNNEYEIVELGGGRGTNCLCILDHLQNQHPGIYEKVKSYTIMDSSPTLLKLMRSVLIDKYSLDGVVEKNQLKESHRHRDKVVLKELNMMDVAERSVYIKIVPYFDSTHYSFLMKYQKSSGMFAKSDTTPTTIFAMELLDNLPHDKITSCGTTGAILQGEIITNGQENSGDTSSRLKEKFNPLSDELLKDILSIQPKYLPTKTLQYGCEWIPSVACGVLKKIIHERPNSSVVLADFDWLPEPQIESKSVQKRQSLKGSFEPLITCMDDVDHLCYMTAPPLCDVLFPTDFSLLAGFSQKLLEDNNINSSVHVMKQSEFLCSFGQEEVEKTRGWLTGYTPLLEDFTNCSVMTISKN